jgi:hypothetical protein
MYLGRVGAAIARGSFTATSKNADGWRAGQNVSVRSTHLGNVNATYRIARVRTSVMGPYNGRPAALRRYEVEFGGAEGGHSDSQNIAAEIIANSTFSMITAVERIQPEIYGDGLLSHENGILYIRANQDAETSGTEQYFAVIGKDVGYGAGGLYIPGTTIDPIGDGVMHRESSRDVLQLAGNVEPARTISGVGWCLYAYPEGGGPLQTPTTARDLPTSGGAIQIPIVVPAHMHVPKLTIWNTDTANLRTAEWALYEMRTGWDVNGDKIVGVGGSFSFTPGVAFAQDSGISGGGSAYLGPGVYMLVIRNTSATQTFGLGEQAAGTIAPTTCKTKTLGSALGATLDLNTGWSGVSALPGVILRGRFPAAGASYY